MSPGSQERKFNPKYALELMRIAEGDFNTAIAISHSKESRLENAFFMAQQAIEKALKAVLVSLSLPIPLVHDLGILLAKLPVDLNPPYGYELNELNQYATIRRYEEGHYELTIDEFEVVIKKCREMMDWSISQMKVTK
ncbi:MAG TPA: HEPN domain-containing protein [Pseudobdellovibrionaceae bacterium]|nr:HEPN domain-containing protein [Pseudobdellovibrionaceae bacterium]